VAGLELTTSRSQTVHSSHPSYPTVRIHYNIPMANIVAVFAHPDDESFGPGGTLIKLAQEHEVYIICVTSGEHGGDAFIRENETKAAASIIGAKEVIFIGFADGSLSNDKYHLVADAIRPILDNLKPQKIMTFEQNGVSGHLDHVAVSMITTYLFDKASYTSELWYFCIGKQLSKNFEDYFVYFPTGRERSEVDEIIDVRDVWNERISLIRCHDSQKHDGAQLEELLNNLPQEEYFLIKKQ